MVRAPGRSKTCSPMGGLLGFVLVCFLGKGELRVAAGLP